MPTSSPTDPSDVPEPALGAHGATDAGATAEEPVAATSATARMATGTTADADDDSDIPGGPTGAIAGRSIYETVGLGLVALALFIALAFLVRSCDDDDELTTTAPADETQPTDAVTAAPTSVPDATPDPDEAAEAERLRLEEEAEAARQAEEERLAEEQRLAELRAAAEAGAERELGFGNDDVTLRGAVADLATKNRMVEAATAAFAPRTVVDDLVIDPDADTSEFEIVPTLVARGTIATQAQKDEVLAGAETVAAPIGAEVVDELELADEGSAEAVSGGLNDLVGLDPVQFATGSAEIAGASNPILDRAIEILTGAPDVRVEVGGHTDNVGNPAANQQLSEARAQAVVTYLTNGGVSPAQLTARGYGQDEPLLRNNSPENRAQNRRIEFTAI